MTLPVLSEIDEYRYEKMEMQYADGRPEKRAKDAMKLLLARPEAELGVCTHGGFLGKEIFHGIAEWEGEPPDEVVENSTLISVRVTYSPSDDTMLFKWVH